MKDVSEGRQSNSGQEPKGEASGLRDDGSGYTLWYHRLTGYVGRATLSFHARNMHKKRGEIGASRNDSAWTACWLAHCRRLVCLAMLFCAAVPGFVGVLSWVSAPALAQEAVWEEEPTPSSVEEIVTSMERTYEEKLRLPGLFLGLKEKLKDAPAFFRDTKLGLRLRTYYYDQDNTGGQIKEAWAIGGALVYQSGWFLDHFSVGAVGYTSQPLYAPKDRGGTGLLTADQQGFSVLGEIYGRVKLIGDNFLNIYRYEYVTPYISSNDSRMVPNTFEGYTFQGAYGGKEGAPGFRYGFGYIDKIKKKDSEKFIPMSEAAGAQVNRGVFVAGSSFAYRGFHFGAIDYYSNDIINIGYAESRYTMKVTERLGLLFAAQFTDQRSVGEDLLTGSSFHTSQFGLMTSTSYRNAILTLAYTNVSTGADMRNPWSGYPGYTGVEVKNFSRAGEEAFMVKGSYNFARLGLEDLTAYALWTHGWGAVDPTTKNPVYQLNEYNVDLQWRPKGGVLDRFWFRARYAHVEARSGAPSGYPINEVRLIVNYDFQLL